MNIDDYGIARSYYDNEVTSQIRDWLYFNPRQRQAVAASISGIGRVETAIEFGSGIGTCGELFAQETKCRVFSLDLSNELIRMGNRMFGGENHAYTEGTLEEFSKRLDHKVDMILLYDVLEHILPADWEGLFDAFGSVLAQEGQVFISTPTPWYQDFLKENQPSGLQPVDLSITKKDVQAIGERIGLQLIRHEEVDVFREGDYQYFWLASSGGEFDRKSLQKDSLLRRHWLLLRKWPRLYMRTFSIKLLWVAVKSILLGGRKIISRDQMGAAS
jgi:hypothetical protein